MVLLEVFQASFEFKNPKVKMWLKTGFMQMGHILVLCNAFLELS